MANDHDWKVAPGSTSYTFLRPLTPGGPNLDLDGSKHASEMNQRVFLFFGSGREAAGTGE